MKFVATPLPWETNTAYRSPSSISRSLQNPISILRTRAVDRACHRAHECVPLGATVVQCLLDYKHKSILTGTNSRRISSYLDCHGEQLETQKLIAILNFKEFVEPSFNSENEDRSSRTIYTSENLRKLVRFQTQQ